MTRRAEGPPTEHPCGHTHTDTEAAGCIDLWTCAQQRAAWRWRRRTVLQPAPAAVAGPDVVDLDHLDHDGGGSVRLTTAPTIQAAMAEAFGEATP